MTLRHRGLSPITFHADGCVTIASHPMPVVRFERTDSTISYLTTELRHWEFSPGGELERIRIRAGPDWLSITGTHLTPLRHALDQLRLHVVRTGPSRPPRLGTQPWVQEISLERGRITTRG